MFRLGNCPRDRFGDVRETYPVGWFEELSKGNAIALNYDPLARDRQTDRSIHSEHTFCRLDGLPRLAGSNYWERRQQGHCPEYYAEGDVRPWTRFQNAGHTLWANQSALLPMGELWLADLRHYGVVGQQRDGVAVARCDRARLLVEE